MIFQMVDHIFQYLKINQKIDLAVQKRIGSTDLINGTKVQKFSQNLANFLGCKYVIP